MHTHHNSGPKQKIFIRGGSQALCCIYQIEGPRRCSSTFQIKPRDPPRLCFGRARRSFRLARALAPSAAPCRACAVATALTQVL